MRIFNRILILGATGRTGRYILDASLHRGFKVNCLVRDKSKVHVQHENLQVFEGSPSDYQALRDASKGCHYLISTLNISRTSDFPWAKLRTPENFLSNVMHNILTLANTSPFKKVVLCSAWGVAETNNDLPIWFRWMIDNSNIKIAYKDHEKQEKLLMQSDLNWTIIRPVGLTNSKKIQDIIESFGNEPKPALTISRKSVARYMIDALENQELSTKTPVISAK
ncbi:MAG: hypothetical protein CMO01_18595 [Thalassobius sp.]|nr:hypothetical protein [Thalassovita sp.]